MSELYGVTNWDFDFRGHKFQGDWQAALGVTVRVPHLSWVSMAGEAKRHYPASIHYQSPWYKEYPLIENHFARLNTALTRGTPLVSIDVIHPVESFWITTGPTAQCGVQRQMLEENFATVTDWLLGSQLDFDFICESQLPSLADEKDAKKVGRMHYDAIVGQVHLVNTSNHWFGPSSYRTEGDNWSYEYQLKRFGILKSPTLTEYTEEPAR